MSRLLLELNRDEVSPALARLAGLHLQPLLLKSGTLRTNTHVQLAGSDPVRIGSRDKTVSAFSVFPVFTTQLTRLASDQMGKAVAIVIRSS